MQVLDSELGTAINLRRSQASERCASAVFIVRLSEFLLVELICHPVLCTLVLTACLLVMTVAMSRIVLPFLDALVPEGAGLPLLVVRRAAFVAPVFGNQLIKAL